jgi:hypothetical protein
MKRSVDPRSFLTTTAVSVGLSLIASPFLYFDIGPVDFLYALIYIPLCIVSGALYVGIAAKRRPDLSISALGFGGALAAMLPAFVLTVADSTSVVLAFLFAIVGTIPGCLSAVVYAMWDEARSLRRNRHSDTPRAMPRSRGRKT